jgi:hypothetical protein
MNALADAISLVSFGCHGNAPAPAVAQDALLKSQTMSPAKPLVDNLPFATAAGVTVAPTVLDNAVLCATARIAGAPLSQGCGTQIQAAPGHPKLDDSWVPVSASVDSP